MADTMDQVVRLAECMDNFGSYLHPSCGHCVQLLLRQVDSSHLPIQEISLHILLLHKGLCSTRCSVGLYIMGQNAEVAGAQEEMCSLKEYALSDKRCQNNSNSSLCLLYSTSYFCRLTFSKHHLGVSSLHLHAKDNDNAK